jgi:hypothetical protein
MTGPSRWRQNDPWENVVLVAGLGAFVGAGVGAGGALFYADRRVSVIEGIVESLDRRVSRLEREKGLPVSSP